MFFPGIYGKQGFLHLTNTLKIAHMRITPKSILTAVAFGVIMYVLIDSIRYGSGWGIAMAVISLGALFITVRLSQKLARIEAEEE